MNQQTFLRVQKSELERLLERAKDDPILAPQLRERIDDAEKELEALTQPSGSLIPKETMVLPRAAIFLRGGGVHDSEGIRPSLAGELLIQYEKMFIEQALYDEREAARKAGRERRPRGTPTPGLLFTGTPRGSFGLEFEPQPTEDTELLQVHSQSLHRIAEALVHVAAEKPEEHALSLTTIAPRVLKPLKQFMTTLARQGAELRLALSDGPSWSLTSNQLSLAVARLDKDVNEESVTVHGTFRGVTLESGVFDIRTDAGEIITGFVSDSLSESELQCLANMTNKPCVAKLEKTTVSSVIGPVASSYVLLNAE